LSEARHGSESQRDNKKQRAQNAVASALKTRNRTPAVSVVRGFTESGVESFHNITRLVRYRQVAFHSHHLLNQ
jgi:hypothetical protein